MSLKIHNVRLLVNDLESCATFYREVLGFEMTWGDQDYTEFKVGDLRLALYRRQFMADVVGTADQPLTAVAQDRVALVFAVDNLDAAYQQLKTQGITFVTEPQDRQSWGIRTAHFRDPDGNLLEIYADLPS
jgi:lactoylglutathione lyase